MKVRVKASSVVLAIAFFGCVVSPQRCFLFAGEPTLAAAHFYCAIFNVDGSALLTANTDDRPLVQLWSAATGELIRQFEGHSNAIHSINFSPDGSRIIASSGNAGVVGSIEPAVRVWDTSTARELQVLKANCNYISLAAYSPNGARVLGVCNSMKEFPPNSIVIWDANRGEKELVISDVATLSEAMHRTQLPLFSPNGKVIVGLVANGFRIRLWDSATSEIICQIEGKNYARDELKSIGFAAIRFSPDGKLLLAALSDKTARFWNTSNGWSVQTFKGHSEQITDARFCFGAKNILTSSNDGTSRLWDAATGHEIRQFVHNGPVTALYTNLDSSRLVTKWHKTNDTAEVDSAKSYVTLWDLSNCQQLARFDAGDGDSAIVAFSPTANRLLLRPATGTVVLIDTMTGKLVREYK